MDNFDWKTKLIFLTTKAFTAATLRRNFCFVWFQMVLQEVPSVNVGDNVAKLFQTLKATVESLATADPSLAVACDSSGRQAMDMASKSMKPILQAAVLWHGRYRLTELRPEHISATCFVFKAMDEHTIDPETKQPLKVALKLMRFKSQFVRELSVRSRDFSHEHVMNVLQAHPALDSEAFRRMPDEVKDAQADAVGQLTKPNAEKLFMIVMPLADRDLFYALKHERWAGRIMREVRHTFTQLVHSIEHMHRKGVVHSDLKPMNIMRTGATWQLIDLDAACEISKESVGHKSSSAYVPPEAIYVDENTDTAFVKSVVAIQENGEARYDLLLADASFDVWSLGCILYQMCNTDVRPLFQGGQDDNLVGVRKGTDNLLTLAEWSPDVKADKLAEIPDRTARNLLAQMLHKDPKQRPSLTRVLAHPFLSGKQVEQNIGFIAPGNHHGHTG